MRRSRRRSGFQSIRVADTFSIIYYLLSIHCPYKEDRYASFF